MRRVIFITVLLGLAGTARAYPQFQLSTGEQRCNQCHFSPSGGGLLNAYGRDAAGDTISAGGNGAFLHGLWTPPSWLALGGDFRAAGLVNDVGATEGAEIEYFPMQADLYARVAVKSFSLYLSVGARGTARYNYEPPLTYLISREHYLMWRDPGSNHLYVRAGRFFAPYGLRLVEHPAYVRRFLGFNTLEETYSLSGGWVEDKWELHVTGFVPDPIEHVGDRGSGVAAYFERRQTGTLAWGAQARISVGQESTKLMAGGVGKLWLPKLKTLVLAQLDLVRESVADVDVARGQLVAYLSGSWFFRRGWMLSLALERFDENLAIKGVARDAASLELQWFPFAHFETSLYARGQLLGTGGSDGSTSGLILLQVHYYL